MRRSMAKSTRARLEVVRQQVAERLSEVCAQELARAGRLHPSYGRLWQSISDQVAGGGKYLRPYIVMLSYEAYGGHDPASVLEAASAWELLHIGLLMHDDVVDRDYSRHGQPNVAGQYLQYYDSVADEATRLHYAHTAGLLAGDLVLSAANRLLDHYSVAFGLKDIFYEAMFQVIGGELLDVESAISNTLIEPQLIAEAKTASYSMIGPLVTGATLAGAPAKQLKLLRQLGRILGVGFQLADDMLVFGDAALAGKSVISDLVEGKRTAVVTEMLGLLQGAARAEAETKLATDPAGNVEYTQHLLMTTDVATVLAKKLADYQAQAIQLIGQLQIPAQNRIEFEKLVAALFYRQA